MGYSHEHVRIAAGKVDEGRIETLSPKPLSPEPLSEPSVPGLVVDPCLACASCESPNPKALNPKAFNALIITKPKAQMPKPALGQVFAGVAGQPLERDCVQGRRGVCCRV